MGTLLCVITQLQHVTLTWVNSRYSSREPQRMHNAAEVICGPQTGRHQPQPNAAPRVSRGLVSLRQATVEARQRRHG